MNFAGECSSSGALRTYILRAAASIATLNCPIMLALGNTLHKDSGYDLINAFPPMTVSQDGFSTGREGLLEIEIPLAKPTFILHDEGHRIALQLFTRND